MCLKRKEAYLNLGILRILLGAQRLFYILLSLFRPKCLHIGQSHPKFALDCFYFTSNVLCPVKREWNQDSNADKQLEVGCLGQGNIPGKNWQ